MLGPYISASKSPTLAPFRAKAAAKLVETVDFPTQKWIHIALTYDGSTIRLYQDGEEVKANPQGGGKLTDETNPLIIGGNENSGGDTAQNNFAGKIARVRIYNRALSGEELEKLRDGDR